MIQPKADCGYPAKSLIDREIASQVPDLAKLAAEDRCGEKILSASLAAGDNGKFYALQYSSYSGGLLPINFPFNVYDNTATPEILIRGGQVVECSVPVTALTITSNTLYPAPTYIKFTTHADWVQATHLTMPETYSTRGTFTIAKSKSYLMTVIANVYSVDELTAAT